MLRCFSLRPLIASSSLKESWCRIFWKLLGPSTLCQKCSDVLALTGRDHSSSCRWTPRETPRESAQVPRSGGGEAQRLSHSECHRLLYPRARRCSPRGGGGWEKPDLNLRGPAETPRNSALGGVRVVWEAGELKWDDRVSDWLDVGAQVFHLIVCVLT